MEASVVFSEDFNLSAGTVLVRKSDKKMCVVHLGTEDRSEYLLPKGRKAMGEAIEVTAVRETFEETGFHCSLLPITMYTRATPQVEIGHTPDRASEEQHLTEPVAISVRPLDNGVKHVFWYVAVVDESQEQDLTTSAGEQRQNVQWFPFETAADLMTHQDEREIVRKVEGICKNSGF